MGGGVNNRDLQSAVTSPANLVSVASAVGPKPRREGRCAVPRVRNDVRAEGTALYFATDDWGICSKYMGIELVCRSCSSALACLATGCEGAARFLDPRQWRWT
jgi:hypothetical protein